MKKITQKLLPLIAVSLFLTSALFAIDYAPDTLWSRQIEIEGFSYLEAKCSARTPDGGLLIGCNYCAASQDYDAVFIKLDSNYDVEWYSVFTSISFQYLDSRIRVTENGDYDVLLSLQSHYYDSIFHLSNQGDSLGLANLGTYIRDAVSKSDGGYIVLRNRWSGPEPPPCSHEILGLSDLLEVQWRIGFEDWGSLTGIERTTNGKYIITGFTLEEWHGFVDPYFHSAMLDDQGVVCLENERTDCLQGDAGRKTQIVGSEYYSVSSNGYYHFAVDDIECLTGEYIENNMNIFIPSDRPEGLVASRTNDGGVICCGEEFRCIKYSSNGKFMWEREYDLDNDENEHPHIWKRDYAVDIYQENNNSYLVIGNDYTVGQGSKPVLISIDTDPSQGLLLLGNDCDSHNYCDGIYNHIRIDDLISEHFSYLTSWNSWGVDGNIRIEISRYFTNGPWEILVEGTPNDGSQLIEYCPPEAEFCYLRISAAEGSIQNISDWSFSLIPSYHKIFFQKNDKPGIYIDTLAFGEVEFGVAKTISLSNWSPIQTPYLFNIRQESAGLFSAVSECDMPGNLDNCLIEVTIAANEVGYQSGVIGLVTNAHVGDSTYRQLGYPYPDSALTMFHFSANVVMNPLSPFITLRRDNLDIIIDWEPVHYSAGGINITDYPLRYFIFEGDAPDGVEYYLNTTIQTELRDVWTIENNQKRFYSVVAAIDSPALSQASQNWTGKSKTFVMNELKQLQQQPKQQ